MKKSDEKFIKNWEKTKELGFKKYEFTHGLGFGILTTIINLLWLQFGEEKNLDTDNFLISAAIMIIVGGASYAGVTWLLNDYIYQKKIKK